jgi:nanoRNase/pAp phosphatase (c-di-AMP/oligoRNAs hydrolase)
LPESSLADGKLFDLFFHEFTSSIAKSQIKISVFTHRQADPDALCAAAGLCLLLQRSFPDRNLIQEIIAPQGVSVLGERICSTFDLDVKDGSEPDSIQKSDFIVSVDCGDSHLLEPYLDSILQSSAKKIAVDHHASAETAGSWQHFDHILVKSEATSTCEIIAMGFPSNTLTKEISRILLTGLMFDSQHLGLANEGTLEAALVLVKTGGEIAESKKILRYSADRSELLARLKAAQRLQFEEVGGKLIVKSEVSSFQASAARMLVEIGADVGLAYGENNEETRLSARSTQAFNKSTGIDLAQEIRKVANHFEIVGGGHPTAASISGKVERNVLVNYLTNTLKTALLQK